MITPDRALVALATGEDLFTPDGDAVVIATIASFAVDLGVFALYALANGRGHRDEWIRLADLTTRGDLGRAE
jgi:hypothetical protein